MDCSSSVRRFTIGVFGLALALALAAGETLRAAEPASGGAPAPRKLTIVGESPAPGGEDPFVVPQGTPEELLAYIEKLKAARPEKMDPASVMAFREKFFKAALEAANRILAGKPNDEQFEQGIQIKVSVLMALKQMNNPDAGKQLEALPDELTKAGKPEMAAEIRAILLQIKLRGTLQAGADEVRKILDEVKTAVGPKPTPESAQIVMMAVEVLEMRGDKALAAEAYRDFAKLLAGSDDAELKSLGAKFEGAQRRLSLVGKPLTLEGQQIDGKPLAWDAYRGKVVLVMFWATWCGPCRAEMPLIREDYEKFHQRGFDVVGVSCDSDRKALETFLTQEKIPWTILYNDDPQQNGMNTPMANYYGVMGIPSLILVGKDGKVVSIDVDGEHLGQELEKLLGPAEAKKS